MKPLVSEFSGYKLWVLPIKNTNADISAILDNYPKGARMVNRKLLHGGAFRVCDESREGNSCLDELPSVSLPPERLATLRNKFFSKWLKRARELSGQEEDLHRSPDSQEAKALVGKRLLPLGEILKDLEYPDVHLVEDICSGFLVGCVTQKFFRRGPSLLSSPRRRCCVCRSQQAFA